MKIFRKPRKRYFNFLDNWMEYGKAIALSDLTLGGRLALYHMLKTGQAEAQCYFGKTTYRITELKNIACTEVQDRRIS